MWLYICTYLGEKESGLLLFSLRAFLLSLSLSLSAFTRLVLHNFNFINTFNAFLSAHIP